MFECVLCLVVAFCVQLLVYEGVCVWCVCLNACEGGCVWYLLLYLSICFELCVRGASIIARMSACRVHVRHVSVSGHEGVCACVTCLCVYGCMYTVPLCIV